MIEPNTVWYLGFVSNGDNYKSSICATVDAEIDTNSCERTDEIAIVNIGLLRVGEMYATQIVRNVKDQFWLLTPQFYSSNYYPWRVNNGFLSTVNSFATSGARPSMYLKSAVRIASNNTGDGTYEHPYDIEL